jgi:hypothetical protein
MNLGAYRNRYAREPIGYAIKIGMKAEALELSAKRSALNGRFQGMTRAAKNTQEQKVTHNGPARTGYT